MTQIPKGYVAFILHAHLPFVRHPDREDVLEEKWLFEAVSETYIPLLSMFEALRSEETDYRITMTITPTLISMLTDPLLQNRYIAYLYKQINLCEKEVERTRNEPRFHAMAQVYLNKYQNDLEIFTHKFNRDLIKGFKFYQDAGMLEIIACAATHGYLPLLAMNPEIVKAQILTGIKVYEKHFGRRPRGIWLPECGYTPLADSILSFCGIEYTILESHGILFSEPRPVYGTLAPVATPGGIAAFGRDIESSCQVWSATAGYPGDFAYRDYYKDIGYDLDYDYIKDHLAADESRVHTGVKYYRITGKAGVKEPYDPQRASDKAVLHACDFINSRERQIDYYCRLMNVPPLAVCPYDAELFGHWWYEGIQWLHNVIRKIGKEKTNFRLVTPGDYIDMHPVMQVCRPCPSSWGFKGYNEIWLNQTNDWIYQLIFRASEQMIQLSHQFKNAKGNLREALDQSARELLLAQSSDWAFIMKTGTMKEYAEKRVIEHIERFSHLYKNIQEGSIDTFLLNKIKEQDNLFPDIDYSVFC